MDGSENVEQAAWMNDVPAVIVNIQRQPGANIISVVDRVKALLPQLQAVVATVGEPGRADGSDGDDSRVGGGCASTS